MNRTLRVAALAVALVGISASAGCTQISALFGVEQASVYDERALVSVEKLYGYSLDQVKAAAPLLTVDQAKKASELLATAESAMGKARKLYDQNADAEASPETAVALAAVQSVVGLLVSAGVLK